MANVSSRKDPDQFCFGAVFHMLGLLEEGDDCFSGISDPALKGLAEGISRYATSSSTPQAAGGRISLEPILLDLVERLGMVLDPQRPGHPRLYLEPTSDREGPRLGYSRDIFRPIPRGRDGDLAMAATCYLLRSYAVLFCRPRDSRDCNAARTALNDIHQANLLSTRLLVNLEARHNRRRSAKGSAAHLLAVRSFTGNDTKAAGSDYFVWSLLLLCEIQRANVYHQIGYLEESERFYRHARNRYAGLLQSRSQPAPGHSSILPDDGSVDARWFLTPTLIRACFQRSKIGFDRGFILESLITNLQCLEALVQLGPLPSGKRASRTAKLRTDWLKSLRSVETALEAERRFPCFDRARVTRCFGDPTTTDGMRASEPALPEIKQLATLVHVRYAPLVARILAAMGFALFTIRPKTPAHGVEDALTGRQRRRELARQSPWLRSYFRFDIDWKKAQPGQSIEPSAMGRYAETLTDAPKKPLETDHFKSQLERYFALELRRNLPRIGIQKGRQRERSFYTTILSSVTQNIDNLITIPRFNNSVLMRRGYGYRRSSGDLSETTVYAGVQKTMATPVTEESASSSRRSARRSAPDRPLGKLVVLRRWQSFNPRIPRPGSGRLRGGGYFLLWKGMGLVIDPGYDFIQNFYDEGFSLEDIDAVLITHSHPDHDDDFSTLMTLIKEWNEYHKKMFARDRKKALDIYLNASAHVKFAAWLQASDVRIGRVIPLPVLRWDKESKDWHARRCRGENVRLNLTPPPGLRHEPGDPQYDFQLEIVPAWHDDVIGKTSALGVKFWLFDRGRHVGTIGYTGDTGAYGLELDARIKTDKPLCIAEHYRDCDVLLGHLGDIRLRELAGAISIAGAQDDKNVLAALRTVLRETYRNSEEDDLREVLRFMEFLNALHLLPSRALATRIMADDQTIKISDWLESYRAEMGRGQHPLMNAPLPNVSHLLDAAEFDESDADKVSALKTELGLESAEIAKLMEHRKGSLEGSRAWTLMEILVGFALQPWQYPFHLGIVGIYRLFQAMEKTSRSAGRTGRVFIVGELPEELTSYRHIIAHWLNAARPTKRDQRPAVQAMTGDIGLHIGLCVENGWITPKVRCTYCNHNNELVCKGMNYVDPEQIVEIPIKRAQGAMMYVCNRGGHEPCGRVRPEYFWSQPELRVV